MLTKPNFQRLLDVAKATEIQTLGKFDMTVVHEERECGTAGCMIGSYNAMVGRDLRMFLSSTLQELYPRCDDHSHFGITMHEYNWLFNEHSHCANIYPVFTRHVWNTERRDLRLVTREQALARLRKFLYYKLHKHELCYDEKYGVSQESRTKEGNHGFATRALAECGA